MCASQSLYNFRLQSVRLLEGSLSKLKRDECFDRNSQGILRGMLCLPHPKHVQQDLLKRGSCNGQPSLLKEHYCCRSHTRYGRTCWITGAKLPSILNTLLFELPGPQCPIPGHLTKAPKACHARRFPFPKAKAT